MRRFRARPELYEDRWYELKPRDEPAVPVPVLEPRTCTSCGEFKEASEYYLRTGSTRLESWCKACKIQNAIEWQKRKRHAEYMRKRYKVMGKAKRKMPRGTAPRMDHPWDPHSQGKVR